MLCNSFNFRRIVFFKNIDFQAPLPDPTVPQGAPAAGGGVEEVAPPGGYYYNSLPGTENRSLMCGELVSVLTEDRSTRLDLADMNEVLASYNAWSSRSTKFVILFILA